MVGGFGETPLMIACRLGLAEFSLFNSHYLFCFMDVCNALSNYNDYNMIQVGFTAAKSRS